MLRRWRRPDLSPVRLSSIDLDDGEPRFTLVARASLGSRGELRWAFTPHASPTFRHMVSRLKLANPDAVRRQFSVSSMVAVDWPPPDPRRLRPERLARPPLRALQGTEDELRAGLGPVMSTEELLALLRSKAETAS